MNDWSHVRNLLCVRLDNLGDVLMTTPALRALKHSLPGCRLTLLASRAGVPAAPYIPEIDDAIEFHAPWMKGTEHADADRDLAMIHALRTRRFDAAIIFTAYSQSPHPAALLCQLARIPLRLAHCRENPYHLLSDWITDPEPHRTVRHEVQRQLDLVAAIGCTTNDERLSFTVPHADAAWARARLRAIGIDLQRPWLLLHPGASAPSRRYPPALWARAANLLAAGLHCPLVFSGDASEVQLVESIRNGLAHPSYSLAGKLDLGKFAAVLAQAPLLLSNNSGPVHLAAALGTPVVDLYALTNPQHTPWRVPSRVLYHEVPCAPCYKSICPQGHHDCLEKVTPETVARETVALLRDAYRGSGDKNRQWRTTDGSRQRAREHTLDPLIEREAPRAVLEPLMPLVFSGRRGARRGQGN